MRVTLLGHASILVEMDGVTCLMDPVFEDPFEEGAVVSCPKRAIDAAKLPKIDVLILSHAHLDHFDIPTLARLSRDCDVLCPKDHQIVYVLNELGFKRVRATDPNTHIVFPTYSFFTTRSHVTNVIEFGVVFKDSSGTFWNQVDTVLFAETIAAAKQACGPIDLLFSMYASQNFNFFEGRSTGFPHKTHEMNLRNVATIAPRVAVPGSAGFRFCGPAEWCNAHLFPVSRERFVRDLAVVAPSVEARIANPGDVFEVNAESVTLHPRASAIARTVEEDTHLLRFNPTAPMPPLGDPNPDGYTALRLLTGVTETFERIAAFVRDAYANTDPVVDEYRRLRARYGVKVVFPGGDAQRCHFGFGPDEASIELDADAGREVDAMHAIAASALVAWVSNEKSYFYFRTLSRPYSTLYALAVGGEGATVEAAQPIDLLNYFVTRKARGAEMALKRRLDSQLAPFRGGPRSSLPSSDDQARD